MAERRMLSMKIMDSDAFLDMPLSAQALYVHLVMRADDDGFLNSPRRIARTVGASQQDLDLLVEKRFLLSFEGGVVVIKHWRMMNSLKNDRLKPAQYPELAAEIYLKPNNAYTEKPYPDAENLLEIKLESIGNKNGIPVEEEGKGTEEELSIAEEEGGGDDLQKLGKFKNVLLTDSQIEDLIKKMNIGVFNLYLEKMSTYIADKGVQIKNHYRTMLKWYKEDSKVI